MLGDQPTFSTVNAPLDGSADAERAAILMSKVGRGDAKALEELYALWSGPLLGVALRILGERGAAEEVLQDTFMRLWQRAEQYNPARGPAFVWAFTILRGFCLDRLKHGNRQKRGGGRLVPFQPWVHGAPAIPSAVLAADDFHRVRRALNHLDEAERECLELAVFLEFTQAEISASTSVPLGTVKHRLRRALAKLRRLLDRHDT